MFDATPPRLVELPPERTGAAVAVLCEAFRDYPVMRYVLGGPEAEGLPPAPHGTPEHRRREEQLERLVTFFVMARVLRREPVLAVEDPPGEVVGVATLTLPHSREAPPELGGLRDETWGVLGPEARERYERLGAVWSGFGTDTPHHHLNMIGVRRTRAGEGLARILLDEVHRRSAEHPDSAGVSLTTEDPRNVGLYRHLGYRVVAEGEIPGALRTWGMFREG